MKRGWLAFIVAVAVSGCYKADMEAQGLVRPLPDGSYEFVLPSSGIASADSPGAERDRIEFINGKMSARDYCPSGWEVIDRQQVTRMSTWGGDIIDIFYTVRCKTA